MSTTTTTQHVLTGFVEQARGVIGRYPGPDEEFVFEFDSLGRRDIHMVGVRRPLEVEWYRDGELVRREVLRPWLGFAVEKADRVIERRPDAER